MFGHQFYHSTLRKYVIIFGTLFNEITLTRTDNNGNRVQDIKVPLYYKLCGAGGGGYLLLIKEKSSNISKFGLLKKDSYIKINIDNKGIKTWKLS